MIYLRISLYPILLRLLYSKLVPCYHLKMTTGKSYCIIGCDWFIDQPMRWPVTFQVYCGLQTVGQLQYLINSITKAK